MEQILASLPPGVWTSYGDLAEVIGSYPVPVGFRIANTPTPNGHRVLTSQGTISPQFRWYQPGRTDDPVEILTGEGITFDSHRRAHPAQRLSATDLADLIGIERDPDVPAAGPSDDDSARSTQFSHQLHAQQTSAASAVDDFIAGWHDLGGDVTYGRGAETSATLSYLPYQHRGHILGVAVIWPLTGTLEFSFQHLKNKEPFSDPSMREELRLRLNMAPGIDIASAKTALRPSVPLRQLEVEGTRDGLLSALEWLTVSASAGRPPIPEPPRGP